MKFSFSYIAITIISLGLFFFIDASYAQADCVVNQATFRRINATGQNVTQFPPTMWYHDSPKPYVYVDVQTSGCANQNIAFSLTEWDGDEGGSPASLLVPTTGISTTLGPNYGGWNDDDVNGTGNVVLIPDSYFADLVAYFSLGSVPAAESFLYSISCQSSNDTCLDNRPIPVGGNEPNFTLALRAGEDECEAITAGDTPECVYYLRFNDSPVPANAGSLSQVPQLRYECETACGEDWKYLQKIEYGTYLPDDPALQENQDDGGTGVIGVTEISIELQNPIGENSMTIPDFIDKVIKFALTVGIPIVAIAIIYSGLLFVMARGNDKQLETAKNAFTYAVIGGAVLLGSWIFARLIRDTIESIVMSNIFFG